MYIHNIIAEARRDSNILPVPFVKIFGHCQEFPFSKSLNLLLTLHSDPRVKEGIGSPIVIIKGTQRFVLLSAILGPAVQQQHPDDSVVDNTSSFHVLDFQNQ